MALIRNIPKTWTTVGPTAADELWQCRGGEVLLTLEAVTDDMQGTLMRKDQPHPVIPAGKTVRYRRLGLGATINREVIG